MSKKTGRLSVRFTSEDMKNIDNISRKEGMWSSTWVRHIVLEALPKRREKKNPSLLIQERTR